MDGGVGVTRAGDAMSSESAIRDSFRVEGRGGGDLGWLGASRVR